MSCPVCGDPEASVGFTTVWCPNVNCSNFDQTQLDEVVARLEDDVHEYDETLVDIDARDMESMWEAIADAIGGSFKGLSSGLRPSDDDQA
jgi:hypothetical protein